MIIGTFPRKRLIKKTLILIADASAALPTFLVNSITPPYQAALPNKTADIANGTRAQPHTNIREAVFAQGCNDDG